MTGNYRFSLLTAQEMPELRQVFLEAFADYFVPIQLTEQQFQAKLKRESINPGFCVGAYAGSKMVGFILTGLGEYKGIPTAYNAGTGVLPAHRGHNLTSEMYTYLIPKLRESGVEQCVLEVIQENAAALKSYKDTGFEITRSLDCFRGLKNELLLAGDEPEGVTITTVTKPTWSVYQHCCDAEPTWQNTATAISHSPDDKIYLEARAEDGEVMGFAAFFPKTGAIAQLAVLPGKRGQGTGKALLREVLNQTTAPALMLINVDADAVAFTSFLKRRNFTRFLGQYEMIMPLVQV
ncbi:GNAT family N-acetyltransferase [Pontibacter sp. KCTC 32443]|uniref:GNAT family N-acetyltransferase n=1 Tax=Pontibacter TaxID=323449 RepID=UPI00164DFC01|nr:MULTISPECIES: GNAT family N-acetyltransferase [Pontibacter]MBC5773963.1 GNAT family N-acetyltransferase [Pontibacter sp. KCTC 32443]